MAFNAPEIQFSEKYFDSEGKPTFAFHVLWDQLVRSLSAEIGALQAADAAQAAAAAAAASAATAQTAANSAQTSANTAQASADDANSVASLTNSGVTGCTITATDAGSNVTVTISAHTRKYGDGTSVSVNGGSVTGLNYSTTYFIYYDQASRAGGAVTYVATTSEATAAQTGDRHCVGMVVTPAAAGPPADGDYVRVPGVGGIIP